MITLPIWAFVLMCVGCFPAAVAVFSFVFFMISNAARAMRDRRNGR